MTSLPISEARTFDADVDAARAASRRAAERGGISLRLLDGLEDVNAAADLWRRVWDREAERPVNPDLLRALEHAGNYAAGAFDDGRMVGAIVGFYGGDGNGLTHLHSHILGVDPEARAHGVGFALKVHQRAWALERGLESVKWTFDPLVRANAYFNLSKLGARGVEYMPNFYGAMPDAINQGDESDRLYIRWEIGGDRAARASDGDPVNVDMDGLRRDGAVAALSVGGKGEPVAGEGDGDVVLCQVPDDIVKTRSGDNGLATEWRQAVRGVMLGALRRGLVADGMSRDGTYVLRRVARD